MRYLLFSIMAALFAVLILSYAYQVHNAPVVKVIQERNAQLDWYLNCKPVEPGC